MLYNYNPFTNIMPLNESWLYYKYTLLDTNIIHNLEYIDYNNTNIYILCAGNGSNGGISNSYYVGGQSNITIGGGGGGTGELLLTKLNVNDIFSNNNKQLFLNIGTQTNTIVKYNNTSNINTTVCEAVCNINPGAAGQIKKQYDWDLGGYINVYYSGNGANSAIYNNSIRPFNKLILQNNIMYLGSAGSLCGGGSSGYTSGNNGITTYVNTNNNNLANKTILTTSDACVTHDFSNTLLPTDNTGTAVILNSGRGGVYNQAPSGDNGFVMIYYKIKQSKLQNGINGAKISNYNPLNNIIPKKNYIYYYYDTYINDIYVQDIYSKNGAYNIVSDTNGIYTVNILYCGGGGSGGFGSATKKNLSGGGGGGGGGEVFKTTIDYTKIKNDLFNGVKYITINSVGNTSKQTKFSYTNTNNITTTYTGNFGNDGKDGSTRKSASKPGGNGGDGLTIRNIEDNNTISYGSGSGGGGGGYNKGGNGNPGLIQTGVNSPSPTSISSKCPRCVEISDIGDETGKVQTSFGGWGNVGNKSGYDGQNGFVLIYYLVDNSLN